MSKGDSFELRLRRGIETVRRKRARGYTWGGEHPVTLRVSLAEANALLAIAHFNGWMIEAPPLRHFASEESGGITVTTPSERLRALHQNTGGLCVGCFQAWPCDTIKALDELEQMYNDLFAIRPTRGQLLAKLKAADAVAEAVEKVTQCADDRGEACILCLAEEINALRAFKETPELRVRQSSEVQP